jgi:hypothetical protein
MFLNLFFSGMNVWLLIASGESLMALRKGKKLQAGLWLAGLLLKPQTLILFIPGLLLTGRTRVMAGFLIGSTLVGSLSLLLAGPSAVLGPLQVISQWPSLYAESGMNWRALGLNWTDAISNAETVSWLIVVTGSIVTTVAALWLWLYRPRQELGSLLYLGTYAATCAVAWSSNIYMALPLLAPGVLLWSEDRLPATLACFWLLFPTAVFLTLAFVRHPGVAHNVAGISMLFGCLVLLLWSVRVSRKVKSTAKPIDRSSLSSCAARSAEK